MHRKIERRTFRRRALRVPVKFAVGDSAEERGVLRNISEGGLFIKTNTAVNVGDEIIAYPDGLGRIVGKVIRKTDNGFAIEVVSSYSDRTLLEKRIEAAMVGLPYFHIADRRKHARFPLRIDADAKTIPAGCEFTCTITDISKSGAFIESDKRLSLGTKVKIGVMRGRVCRLAENGFAIKFERAYEPTLQKRSKRNARHSVQQRSSNS